MSNIYVGYCSQGKMVLPPDIKKLLWAGDMDRVEIVHRKGCGCEFDPDKWKGGEKVKVRIPV